MGTWNEAYQHLKAMIDAGVPVEQVANAKLDELIAADISTDTSTDTAAENEGGQR